MYNACNDLYEGVCTCIDIIPSDGQMCVTKSELPFFDILVEIELNTTSTMLDEVRNLIGAFSFPITFGHVAEITDVAITAVNTTTTANKTNTNTTTTSTATTRTTVTPSIQTTTLGVQVLSFSLTINEVFDFALTDQSSEKYNTYKQKIESSIDNSYRTLLSYEPNSATVTAFRPGSVITDFTIKTTNATLNLASANQDLASSLRLQGFNVSDTAFIQSVKDGLYGSSGNIYPGTNLTLTCNPPVNNSIQWTLDGKLIEDNSNNILQLNNATSNYSGQYACTTTVNSIPYVIWQTITIQPYPNIEVSTNKVVQCEDTTILLQCCVQEIYQVEWTISCTSPLTGSPAGCILCDYTLKQNDCQTTKHVTCKLKNPINGITTQSYNSKSIIVNVTNKAFTCSDSIFGAGNQGDVRNGDCNKEMVGYQVAWCNSSNRWQPIEDYCVLRIFATLKDEAENLQVGNLPQFMANVRNNAVLQIQNITDSQATILTIVEILKIISSFSQTILINQPVMTNFLQTTDVIGSDDTRDTWVLLNKNNTTMNASSELLNSTESIARRLRDESISIITNISSLNKTSITAPFSGTFGKNLTTQINIPATSTQTSLTVIISSAFNNVLPVRNLTNNNSSQTGTSINGDVVLIETNSTINNISLSIDIKNNTLGIPQCVFWNFNLLNDIGGWDSTGCQLKKLGSETERITCECNHTTSFSILMSPFTLDKNFAIILDYITYIGVAISLGSLVLCLIIEMIIWKSVTRNDTSYMRHVSIVNIAVSLLIANICFIIGAAVVKKGEGPCSTATFFMHFFYLALFFWMLLSALLLLYRTLMVFSRMTRGAMMAIAFTVGYGAPLIIAVITVASTAGSQGYIQKDYNCWLNWSKTKALLAFVIPALTIVAINLLVLIVVLCKMLRRGVNATTQPDEKHPLMVIARCVAILTPLFGLTWGFGIGTMVSPNFGIHVVFAFLNSLQGFFILMFGTLLDSKVRETLAQTFSLSNLSSIRTRSTSAGPSSSSGFPFFQRLRQRNVYNVLSPKMSSSNSDTATDSYAARAML
ncbi:adhesion G-protein coupled receptor F1-like [Ictalurus punctatus]|uniref:Adhesion G-protein coupled receptor F1-like n=1 Tax=Ictalurus punctatus TaxID=7998 RepID=A0A9F7RDE1_ICTPU|nr:adhesion G-protein coupled receptor F1-like [Ictalurus punctatus]